MLECKRCGTRNSDLSEFCFECGSPLGGTGKASAIDGKYDVIECLESEEARELYKVRDIRTNEVRTLKACDLDPAVQAVPGFDPCGVILEAARLRHPNVADVLDCGVLPNGRIYTVSEWVAGESVDRILAGLGPLPAPLVIRLAGDSLRGLHHLHQHGFLHRNLTPSKLMVFLSKHGAPRVKLIHPDLATPAGVVRAISPLDLMAGKGKYSSPEQLAGVPGGGELDARTDIYSLALIIYELLKGNVPFSANTMSALVFQQGSAHIEPLELEGLDPETAEHFNQLLLTALAKDREHRFPNALAFEEALNQLDLPPLTAETIQHYFGSLGSVRPSGAFSAIEPPPRMTPAPSYDTEARTVMTSPVLGAPTVVVPGRATPQPPAQDDPLAGATVVTPRAVPNLEATVMESPDPAARTVYTPRRDATRIDDGTYEEPPSRERTRIDHLETQAFELQGEYEILQAPQQATEYVYPPPPSPEELARPLLETDSAELGKGFTGVVGTIIQTAPDQPPQPSYQPPYQPPQAPPLVYEDEPPARPQARPRPAPSAYSTIQAPRVPQAPPPKSGKLVLWLIVGVVVVGLAVASYFLFFAKTVTGTLALNMFPWGTVQSIENEQGKKFDIADTVTPLTAELPVGNYKAQVKIAETDKVITVSFTIREGQLTSVTEQDPGYSYEEFLRQII